MEAGWEKEKKKQREGTTKTMNCQCCKRAYDEFCSIYTDAAADGEDDAEDDDGDDDGAERGRTAL